MQLHLKRNKTKSSLGATRYDLFAQLELTPEEQERVKMSKPQGMFLWEDDGRASTTHWRLCLIPGGMVACIAGAISAYLFHPVLAFFVILFSWIPFTKLIFNQVRPSISVADIITGRTLHCKSMEELYVKENAIREKLKNFNNYIAGMRPTTGEGETVTFD